MSRHTARVALDQLVGKPAFIAQVYATKSFGLEHETVSGSGLLDDLRELARAAPGAEMAAALDRRETLAAAYGFPTFDASKPFTFSQGKAIIPIHGALINRFPYSWSFATGYNFIRAQTTAALGDPDVETIIYDVNSYGGMVSGCEETADLLFAADKPTLAVVDANCYSAAYMLASQCDRIAVTPSGGVGSVGVVMMHVDVSKALEEKGINISFIFAGKHKVDGNMFEALSPAVRASLQADVNAAYDMFVGKVARGRDMDEKAVRATEAQSYRADEALDLGLIDAVQNPANAIQAFCDDQEITMATKPTDNDAAAQEAARIEQEAATAASVAAAASAARETERTRITSIQNHAEAKGREGLAAYLALQTDLSAEVAGGILANSPKASESISQRTNFERAMDNGQHPDVGAGGGEETDDGMTPAQKILRAQARQTGYEPPPVHRH